MLILGAEILLGFQYRAVLEPEFPHLSQGCQRLSLAALFLILVTTALLMTPGAYHRIVWEGEDEPAVLKFTTRLMDVALAPFALAFGLAIYVALAGEMGPLAATGAGLLITLGALACWYGPGLLARERPEHGVPEAGPTSLKDKLDQALIEIRVVLPGAQALLGFQLACVLMDGFKTLPAFSRELHLFCTLLMVLAVMLMMSPPAYHRLALRGEVTRHLNRFTNRAMLASMVPLSLSLSGEVYVVSQKVLGSTPPSLLLALAALTILAGAWFAFPFYARSRRPPLGSSR